MSDKPCKKSASRDDQPDETILSALRAFQAALVASQADLPPAARDVLWTYLWELYDDMTMSETPRDVLERLESRERRLRTRADDPYATGTEGSDADLFRDAHQAIVEIARLIAQVEALTQEKAALEGLFCEAHGINQLQPDVYCPMCAAVDSDHARLTAEQQCAQLREALREMGSLLFDIPVNCAYLSDELTARIEAAAEMIKVALLAAEEPRG